MTTTHRPRYIRGQQKMPHDAPVTSLGAKPLKKTLNRQRRCLHVFCAYFGGYYKLIVGRHLLICIRPAPREGDAQFRLLVSATRRRLVGMTSRKVIQ